MPVPLELAEIDRLLAHAERATALLDRCRPTNAAEETERAVAAWERGNLRPPEWRYRPTPELGRLLHVLEVVGGAIGEAGPWGALYAARARELWLEASLVEALGSPTFRGLAAVRFPVEASPGGSTVDALAAAWAAEAPDATGPTVAADDARDPASLLTELRRLIGALRLPVRLTVSKDLPCSAATGEGFIVVRSGVRHTASAARRIARHEVHGHALPRHRARAESLGLFAVGTASGPDDEEGRALLIEERSGLLDAARRHELGVRHLAARAVREGADWVETVRLALARGATVRAAVDLASRLHRGGGLAREVVYLPALCRVRAAFADDPSLETWLERGRIGVRAARILSLLGCPPTHVSVASHVASSDQRNTATTGA